MSKPKNYMISVQWGGGPHYFMPGGFETGTGYEQIEKAAREIQDRAMKQRASRKNRGAKPTTYVWELRYKKECACEPGKFCSICY